MKLEWWPFPSSVPTRHVVVQASSGPDLEALKGSDGYLELSPDESGYPMLALSFADGRSVVHHFPAADRCLLLLGDGSLPMDQAVPLPIFTEPAEFTGGVVSSANRAWAIADAFVDGSDPATLGQWTRL